MLHVRFIDCCYRLKLWVNDTTLLYNIIELCKTKMLNDRVTCHKVLDQHVWWEIEIKMAALQDKRKILVLFAILELLEHDINTTKENENA